MKKFLFLYCMTFFNNVYTNLKPVSSLVEIFKDNNSIPVPEDWYVVIADIEKSTKAIEEGRYKDVNTAGALATIAISNEFGTLEFPFIFGGDGATFLIPKDYLEKVKDILIGTSVKVREFFDLDMRIGIVPVRSLVEAGHTILMGKIQISPYYVQSAIIGNGIHVAENWIKRKEEFVVKNNDNFVYEPNFKGYTCRWLDIPSPKEETIALIIYLRTSTLKQEQEMITQVFSLIESIYGHKWEHHPLYEKGLSPAISPRILWREAAARSGKTTGINFFLKLMRTYLELFVTITAMKLKLPLKVYFYNLKEIKKFNIISSDYMKYDGMLKMVLAGTKKSREKLITELDKLEQEGKLYYGIHVSNRAILTCLLQTNSYQEVHFVDVADGGYTLAARMLKDKISNDK